MSTDALPKTRPRDLDLPNKTKRERLPNKFKTKSRDEAADKPINIKATIRKLIIDRDLSVDEIQEAIENQGIELSRIAISAVRTETREVIKMLTALNLLDLAKHRRRKGSRR